MPIERVSGPPMPQSSTGRSIRTQPAVPIRRNSVRVEPNRAWAGRTKGEVSEEVLRQIQADPSKADEIFAKMSASGQKSFAARVNEYGGGFGPVGRGAVRGAEGVGRFAVNSVLRGMSYIPGLEDWSDQADHNNRLAAIQAAYDTYQDEHGTTSDFIGADASRLSGALGETATQMTFLGGAGRAAGATSKMGMTKFMAASYGAMDAERSITVAKDAGYQGWQKNAYAAGNGAISAALTYGFGAAANKFGGNTAEQLMARGGGRLAQRLMSWNGVKGALIDMGWESGEEGTIQLAKNLWSSTFGMQDWDQYANGVGSAMVGGAVTSGFFGGVRGLQGKFNKMVEEIPSTLKGWRDAQAASEKGGEVTPEMEAEKAADPIYARSFDAETEEIKQYKADAEELGIVDKTREKLEETDAKLAEVESTRKELDERDKILDANETRNLLDDLKYALKYRRELKGALGSGEPDPELEDDQKSNEETIAGLSKRLKELGLADPEKATKGFDPRSVYPGDGGEFLSYEAIAEERKKRGAGPEAAAPKEDDLFDKAVEVLKRFPNSTGKVTVLQRELRLGYGAASKLFAEIEAAQAGQAAPLANAEQKQGELTGDMEKKALAWKEAKQHAESKIGTDEEADANAAEVKAAEEFFKAESAYREFARGLRGLHSKSGTNKTSPEMFAWEDAVQKARSAGVDPRTDEAVIQAEKALAALSEDDDGPMDPAMKDFIDYLDSKPPAPNSDTKTLKALKDFKRYDKEAEQLRSYIKLDNDPKETKTYKKLLADVTRKLKIAKAQLEDLGVKDPNDKALWASEVEKSKAAETPQAAAQPEGESATARRMKRFAELKTEEQKLRADVQKPLMDRIFEAAGQKTGGRVWLKDIREALPDVPREEFDAEMLRLMKAELVVLYPSDDPREVDEKAFPGRLSSAILASSGKPMPIAYFSADIRKEIGKGENPNTARLAEIAAEREELNKAQEADDQREAEAEEEKPKPKYETNLGKIPTQKVFTHKETRSSADLARIDSGDEMFPGIYSGPMFFFSRLKARVEGKGIGKALLKQVLNYSDKINVPILNEAMASGKMSQEDLEAFYLRNGFEKTHIPSLFVYWPGSRTKTNDQVSAERQESRAERAALDEAEQKLAAEKEALAAEQKAKADKPDLAKERAYDEMLKRQDERQNARDVEELASVQRSNLALAAQRYGVDALPEPQRRQFIETIQQVWDEGLHLHAMEIVQRTKTTNETWNAKTTVAVGEGIRLKERQYAEVKARIDNAAPDESLDNELAREKVLRDEILFAIGVADAQQSEKGYSFLISRLLLGDTQTAMRRAERSKGEPLTDDEKAKILAKGAEIEAIQKKQEEGRASKEELKELDEASKRVKRELSGEQKEERDEMTPPEPRKKGEKKPRKKGEKSKKTALTEAEQVEQVLEEYADYDPEEAAEKLTRTEFEKTLARVKSVLYDERSSDNDRDDMVTSMDTLLELADQSGNFSDDDKAEFKAEIESVKAKVPHEAWKLRKVVEDFESGKTQNKLDRPEFDKLLSQVRGVLNSDKTTDAEKTSALNSARRLLNLASSDTSDFKADDKLALASDIETLSKQIKERRRVERAGRIISDVDKIAKTLEKLKNYDPANPKSQVAADELTVLLAKAKKIHSDPNATQKDRDTLYSAVENLQVLARQLGGARPGTPEYEALNKALFIARNDLDKLEYITVTRTAMDKAKVANRIWHESVLTGDMSQMGIQSGLMAVMRPTKYVQAMVSSLKGVNSEAEMDAYYDHLTGPNGDLYREGFTTLIQPDGALSLGEDAGIVGVESIIRKGSPTLANGLARIQRIYRMGINAARVGTFEGILNSWGGRGKFNRDELMSLGTFADALTLRGGRGYLDKAVRGFQVGFLAPRNMAAYMELISLYHLWKPGQTGKVRLAVAWEYGKMLRGWGSIAIAGMVANYFSNLAGNGNVVDVVLDPLNKRFLQMKIGNTWIDPSIRLGSYLNAAARFGRAAKTSVTQEKLSQKTGSAYDAQALTSFARGKLSFPVGAIVDLGMGENIVGEPTTIGNILANRFTPIAPREIYKAAVESGMSENLAGSVIEITGFRADYDDPQRRKKNKRN
jgi:hypothetical protein